MAEEIVNKVAQSGLITLDLADFCEAGERVLLDISPQLHMGMLLREKDFREFVKSYDLAQYSGKHLAVTCTADAIVPVWAYMLVATAAQPYARTLVFGNLEDLEAEIFRNALSQKLDLEQLRGKKVVIKGCGEVPVPVSAFVEVSRLLRPVADKIMYGEPCSTVPVFKR